MFGSRRQQPSLLHDLSLKPEDARHYMSCDVLDGDRRMQRINQMEQQFVTDAIQRLPVGACVLDMPCGNGRMSKLVRERDDLHLVSMDYNLDMLSVFAELGFSSNLTSVARADALAIPLADRSVDLVINMRLLHHVPEPDQRCRMLSEMARVCRGEVVTSFFNKRCWRYVRRRMLGKAIRGFPILTSDFREVCDSAGLTIEELVPVGRWVEEQCLVRCRGI